jgi:hypothetical protein
MYQKLKTPVKNCHFNAILGQTHENELIEIWWR